MIQNIKYHQYISLFKHIFQDAVGKLVSNEFPCLWWSHLMNMDMCSFRITECSGPFCRHHKPSWCPLHLLAPSVSEILRKKGRSSLKDGLWRVWLSRLANVLQAGAARAGSPTPEWAICFRRSDILPSFPVPCASRPPTCIPFLLGNSHLVCPIKEP